MEKVLIAILISHFILVSIIDFHQKRRIKRCTLRLIQLKEEMLGDSNAFDVISNFEGVAILQIENQTKQLEFCRRCPLYLHKCKTDEYLRLQQCNQE